MSPDRKEIIGNLKVEQYYWAGKTVVYLNNHAVVDTDFNATCAALREGKEVRTVDYTGKETVWSIYS
jgi:hypothetical protein